MSQDTSQPAGSRRGRLGSPRAAGLTSRSGKSRHRHRHRRRRDLRWLLIGILAPLPLVVLVVLLAESSRNAWEADPDPLPEAGSPEQHSLAIPKPGTNPGAVPTPRCPPAGEVIPAVVEAAACGDLTRLRDALASQESLAATDPRSAFVGFTALHHLAARGDLEGLRTVIEAGAAANSADANGNTPLHLLAIGDRVLQDDELARILIRAGGDPDRKNRGGQTPLEALLASPRHATASPGLLRAFTEHAEQFAVVDRARSYLGREAPTGNDFKPLRIAEADLPGVAPGAPPAAAGALASATAGGGPAADEATLRADIEAWARAWNGRRADEVLAHYAVDFIPADGSDRASWETQQRRDIARAKSTGLTVTDLRLELRDDRASAHFTQGQGAPEQRTGSPKTIEFRRSAGGWKIVAEHDGS